LKPTTPTLCGGRRRRARGNAILEFVLTLPILFFVTGLTMYMAIAMLTKQHAVLEARCNLWESGGWYWPPMKLEGYTPLPVSSPIPVPANAGDMPRGSGDDLAWLIPEIEPKILATTTNPEARNDWAQIRDNMPGRHQTHTSESFTTDGQMWNFIDKTASGDHYRDSSPWHYDHLDIWKIMRCEAAKEIWQDFYTHLYSPPPMTSEPFYDTCHDILNRWFEAKDILDKAGSGG